MVEGDGAWCVELRGPARHYRVCLDVFALWKNVQNLWCENVSICLSFPLPQLIFILKYYQQTAAWTMLSEHPGL